jgi:hypothetical protein
MADLYADLEKVHTFRNSCAAHVESRLDDAGGAWQIMAVWFRCLDQMIAWQVEAQL